MRALLHRRPNRRLAAGLAVVTTILGGSVALVARPASAAPTVLRPNGDVSHGWQSKPGGPAWDALNDPVVQPAAVPATNWIWAGAAGKVTELGFTSTAVASAAIATGSVWFYANTGPTTQLKVEVIWSGQFRDTRVLPAATTFGWHEISVAPDRQPAVDDLRVRITSVGGGDTNVRAVYASLDVRPTPTVLDWENPAQRTLPGAAPEGWKTQLCCRDSAGHVVSPVRSGQWASRFESRRTDPPVAASTGRS